MLLMAIAIGELCQGANAEARGEAVGANPLVRVLVELRVAPDSVSETGIADVQRQVLARLVGTHAVVARRYRSVPLLALEVDASALARLERMTDLVLRVVPDEPARTQGDR